MENNTFLASDYGKEQIDATKKIPRVYFSGDIGFSKNLSGSKPNIDNENLKKVSNKLDDKITRDDLIRYVNDVNITTYNDENKLCSMYDANRKFTIEREITFENYLSERDYGSYLDKWTNKYDNTLHNSSSDLQSVTYSSMLDICCEKMGIPVVGICEDDFGWTDDHAIEKLNEIVNNIRKGDFC